MKNLNITLTKVLAISALVGLTSSTLMAQTMEPTTAPIATVAGCTNDKFVVGGENNEIKLVGTSYSPKCLKVKLGAIVSIEASSRHPLMAMPDINGAKNPFAASDKAIAVQTRKMVEPGVFGYYCNAHGDSEGDGMAGVIIVE